MSEDSEDSPDESAPPSDLAGGRPLRRGWTTGACAAAAAKAAFVALHAGDFPDPVTIRLPKDRVAAFELARTEQGAGFALAGVVKDAGDDPDVTHGALIVARVARAAAGAGVSFHAGAGVGTVTRPGLPIPPGEPAINPGPRAQIAANIADAARDLGCAADATVTLSVPGGERIAEKTLNGRLGIVGGISILGTTGIVVPYSCSAWIDAIHRGVDVARAAGLGHIAAATGRTSEDAARRLFDLPEMALIDMGDFAGGLLKYLRRHPVARLTLAGGFGKLAKLAQGHIDLHSARSRLDLARLAELALAEGADAATAERIKASAGGAEALIAAGPFAPKLAAAVAREARAKAAALTGDAVCVEACVFDRQGNLLARADA